MLEELGRVRDGWSGPWCLGGDFNEILYVYERNTGVCPSNAMAEFRDFINQKALVDLSLRGGDFTWSRSGVGSVASRLDRFLMSVDWEEFFPDMVQKRMARPFSDHFSICFETLISDRGKPPFRFENMWLESEGFSDLISEWCGELRVPGFANFLVTSKLKFLKEKLKVWNKEIFGDIKARKFHLLESINILDSKEEASGLSSEECEQTAVAKAEWAKISFLEEISWRQKSRALWLNAGDRNTKFFHRDASLHRKFNFISFIEVDGIRFDTMPAMKSAILGFYKSLFTESKAWRPQVDGLLLSQLQATKKESVELPFYEDEVSRALF